MIINPYYNNNSDDVVFTKRGLALSASGNGRLESIIKRSKDKLDVITHTGKVIGDKLYITDYLKNTFSAGTPEENHAAINCMRLDTDSVIDENGELLTDSVFPVISIRNYPILPRPPVVDNRDLFYTAHTFEDDFNVSYMNTIGALASVASCNSIQLPYYIQILADTGRGFNLKRCILPTNDEFLKDKIIKEIQKYLMVFSKIFRIVQETSVTEKRSFIFTLDISSFEQVINIFDKEFNNKMFRMQLNNTDHLRLIRSNLSYDSTFKDSELFHNLLRLGCPTLIDSLGNLDANQPDDSYEIHFPEFLRGGY